MAQAPPLPVIFHGSSSAYRNDAPPGRYNHQASYYHVQLGHLVGIGMNSGSHWLTPWIDEQEISADWEARNVLKNPASLNQLLSLVAETPKSAYDSQGPASSELGESIVAGSGVDLSGTISCNAYECMRNNIDDTFKNVWHYFDRIVVQGAHPWRVAERFRTAKTDDTRRDALEYIVTQVRLILYLRSIGAEEYVYFANKPYLFCQHHWQEHAEELGIGDALDPDRQKKIVARMIKDSSFETRQIGNNLWGARLSGPGVGGSQGFTFPSTTRPTRKWVARYILSSYAMAMISDIGMSQEMHLPLVEPTSVPWIRNQPGDARLPIAESVALELKLPVLRNLSTADFLKIRRDRQPEFIQFQNALRREIQSRLVPENLGKSAGEIARDIELKVLRPELAKIELHARASRKAVIKSSAATLAISAVSASLGALTSFPWLIAAGAIGAAPLSPLITKYIYDMNTPVPISEFYFLWNAMKHFKH